jgi:nicotinamide-nucleotide amidase
MKIGLLIIGNEILEGKIADANTRQLARFLLSRNLELMTSLTVRDTEASIHQGLERLFSDCEVIITSGGLGPTKDDVTKETIASWMGRKVIFSDEALAVATQNYQRFQRVFAGKEHGYSYLPEGFNALENSTGFAPGLFTIHQGKYLLCGPGVPREFKSLLDDHFDQKILSAFAPPSEVIELFTVRTKRIPEEKIFRETAPTLWGQLEQYGTVSSLPHIMGVDIGVKIKGANTVELERKKSELRKIFESSPLMPNIWNFGTQSLEELIVGVANRKNISYGFAESCTGGLCSHRVTGISGSSQTFLGSVVCYSVAVKAKSLGVKTETLNNYGAVSEEAAKEMAVGVARSLNLDVGVSITGFAGPGGGSPEKPVGTVYVGVHAQGKTQVFHYQFPGDREQLKQRFSQAALYLLLEELEKFAVT